MTGFVVWFTGLSGSGKSTLASMLAAELGARGLHVELLDGDEVRTHLSKGLGFSREDRDTNVRRIGFAARLVARAGACAITAAISPYRATRDELRALAGDGAFVEVFCDAPVTSLAARDPKGLYEKALRGEIKHFTGVDDPYEPPVAPDVRLMTADEPPAESLARLVAALEARGLVRARGHGHGHAGVRGPAWASGAAPRVVVGSAARAEAARGAAGIARVACSLDVEATARRLGEGVFAPLAGFMTAKDVKRVRASARLETGAPFGLPVVWRVPRADADRVAIGERVALVRAGDAGDAGDGEPFAVVSVDDVFELDGDACLGGRLEWVAVEQATATAACLAEIARRGFATVGSYAPAGAFDRGDERAARLALELADGVLIRPLEGEGGVATATRALRYFPAGKAFVAPLDALASPDAPGDADHEFALRRAMQLAIAQRNAGADVVVLELGPAAREARARARELLDEVALGVRVVLLDEPVRCMVVGEIVTRHSAASPDATPLRDEGASAARADVSGGS